MTDEESKELLEWLEQGKKKHQDEIAKIEAARGEFSDWWLNELKTRNLAWVKTYESKIQWIKERLKGNA